MNVDTGELRNLASILGKSENENYRELARQLKDTEHEMTDEFMEAAKQEGFEPIPPKLEPAAKKKLAGKDSVMVSLTSGGKLSKWAAKKRKEKRKMAALSRKINR
jgi:hypothetical protein